MQNKAKEFKENGYTVVRRLFDLKTVEILQTYFNLKYIDSRFKNQTKTSIKEGEVADSFGYYSDVLIETISILYGSSICKILELDLSPTYTFARIYEKGNILVPHIDRVACEVSATCPISISDEKCSSIYLSKFKFNGVDRYNSIEEIKKLGEFTRIDLFPGDALIYSGCEYYHWREPLESEYLTQFFMHYVETNGSNSNYILDKRPYMGFNHDVKV